MEGGLINTVIEALGGEPVSWLGYPYTMLSVSIVSGWLFAGFFMTIFYSGLSRVSRSVIESAVIDGASPFQIYLRSELPLIKNLIMLSLLIVTTGVSRVSISFRSC
jgi:raffinose/stachyose/melibiose transport system permease protein